MADRHGYVKRLFVAVDIDDPAREQIASLTDRIREGLKTVRLKADTTDHLPRMTWVRPDRLHLTLEFFGDAHSAQEQQVLSSLAQPFPIAPFDLAFRGLGFFPPRGAPRVLWLGISEGLVELRRIHGELRRRLGAKEDRAFHPHLTLARFRDRAARPDAAKLAKMDASAGPCRIDRVTLYESRLSPSGPTYTALAQGALSS